MDIKIRFMTFDEYGAYQDYVEELNDKGFKESKISRMGAAWIMKNIYNVDVAKTNIRAGVILDVLKKTIEETFKEEASVEKN